MSVIKTPIPFVLATVGLTMSVVLGFPLYAEAASLMRQLDVGMSGDDVVDLQQFLGTDPSIYPEELMTGYFGVLTEMAVKRYQARNGLPPVGRIGPRTLALINSQIGNNGIGGSDDAKAPILYAETVRANKNSATFTWTTDEIAFASVRYADHYPFALESAQYVEDKGGLSTYQTVTIRDLLPNTTYYYSIASTDPAGNVSMSTQKSFTTNNADISH